MPGKGLDRLDQSRRLSLPSVIVLLAAFAVSGFSQDLPALPELSHVRSDRQLPAIREEIDRAYASAAAHPKDPALVGKLGMVLHAYQQYEAAEASYRRAHLLEPSAFRWLYYLGWVQAAQGHYDRAAATLGDALRLTPGDSRAELKLGECLLALGRWDEAGKLFGEVLLKHPQSAEAQYGLGRVRAARRDGKAAIESFLRACELYPNYGAAHYALALAYRTMGQGEKAQEQFRLYEQDITGVPPSNDHLMKAVRELDWSPSSQVRLGIELERRGNLAEAAEAHERALEIDPGDVQAHINLISLYGRLGQVERAEANYEAAVRLDPDAAEAYYDHGVLLFAGGRYEEAEKAFRKALAIDPYHPEAHNNLGFLLERQARLAEAAEEFQKAIDNRPDYRLAHFHLGRILVNANQYPKGIEHLLKTISPEDESTPGYLYAVGAAYGRAGDRENALRYLRQARDQASTRGQKQLLDSIEKDLQTLDAR